MKQQIKRLIYPFTPREPTPRDRYAGYYERVFASTIDLMMLFTLLYEPFAWISRLLYGNASPSQALAEGANISWQQALSVYVYSEQGELVVINFFLQVVVIGVFVISCERVFGTTPGRYLVGLKLVDAQTEQAPTLFQLIRRFLGYFLSLPPLMFGYIWCSWDKKRQTWHDKVAGTVVLDLRPRGWYWAQVKRLYRKARGLPDATPPANDNDG